MFRSAADDVICKSLKIDKTTVGTPRCGVRSAQRADLTIRPAPSDLCHARTKNHAQRVGKPQHDNYLNPIHELVASNFQNRS